MLQRGKKKQSKNVIFRSNSKSMPLAHHNRFSLFWQQSIFHIKATVPPCSDDTQLAAHFTHFLILASIQIMNFQYVLALFSLALSTYSKKKCTNVIFFSHLDIALKSTIGKDEKKECFVWPLNRFLLGRIINNRTVKTTLNEKERWTERNDCIRERGTQKERTQNDNFYEFLFTRRHIIRYVTTHRKGYDYCESERIHITPTTTQTTITTTTTTKLVSTQRT